MGYFYSKAAAGGGGITYVVNDPLAHVDGAAAALAQWVDNTVSPWGSTVSPAPLAGNARSFRAVNDQSSYRDYVVGSISSQAIRFVPEGWNSGSPELVAVENADSTAVLFKVILRSATQIRMQCGASVQDVAYTPGTEYRLKIDYDSATRTATFYLTTNGTWGAPVATLSNAATPSPALPVYTTLGTTFGNANATFANFLVRDAATIPDNAN